MFSWVPAPCPSPPQNFVSVGPRRCQKSCYFSYFSLVVRNPPVEAQEYRVRSKQEGSIDSIYSARGWQFERNSPYAGSAFSGIDGIPGLDEDGLPAETI